MTRAKRLPIIRKYSGAAPAAFTAGIMKQGQMIPSSPFADRERSLRNPIRSRQEQEQAELFERFEQLDGDGSEATEPIEAVLKIAKRVKKERRA